MLTVEKLWETLPVGCSYAVSGKDLAFMFGVSDREIRHMVRQARKSGLPICSYGFGYFRPNTSFDIDMTIRHIQDHVKQLNSTLCSLQKCSAIGKEVEKSGMR